jgi:hypothetical protein
MERMMGCLEESRDIHIMGRDSSRVNPSLIIENCPNADQGLRSAPGWDTFR